MSEANNYAFFKELLLLIILKRFFLLTLLKRHDFEKNTLRSSTALMIR